MKVNGYVKVLLGLAVVLSAGAAVSKDLTAGFVDFFAPSYNDPEILTGAPTGSIAYDMDRGVFRGKDQDGVWQDFHAPVEEGTWYVDASLSGNDPNLTTSAQATYTGITNSVLSLTQNSGSTETFIACAGTEVASASTCSASSESVGISFVPPVAGVYRACAAFSHAVTTGSGGGGDALSVFQLVETPNNSQAISQEGNSRIMSRISGVSLTFAHPYELCGLFTFSDTSRRTLRLYYEQTISGTVNTNVLVGNNTNTGQTDIHWEVFRIQ